VRVYFANNQLTTNLWSSPWQTVGADLCSLAFSGLQDQAFPIEQALRDGENPVNIPHFGDTLAPFFVSDEQYSRITTH